MKNWKWSPLFLILFLSNFSFGALPPLPEAIRNAAAIYIVTGTIVDLTVDEVVMESHSEIHKYYQAKLKIDSVQKQTKGFAELALGQDLVVQYEVINYLHGKTGPRGQNSGSPRLNERVTFYITLDHNNVMYLLSVSGWEKA